MREPLLATNRQVMAAMVAAGRMWMRKRRMNSLASRDPILKAPAQKVPLVVLFGQSADIGTSTHFLGSPMPLDMLVKNVSLGDVDGLRDLGIAGGRFVSIEKTSASAATLILDAEGRMAVPGFVEPHIHLDKALISERAPVNVSGTLT